MKGVINVFVQKILYYTILYYTILIFNFSKNILLCLRFNLKSFLNLYLYYFIYFISFSLNTVTAKIFKNFRNIKYFKNLFSYLISIRDLYNSKILYRLFLLHTKNIKKIKIKGV